MVATLPDVSSHSLTTISGIDHQTQGQLSAKVPYVNCKMPTPEILSAKFLHPPSEEDLPQSSRL